MHAAGGGPPLTRPHGMQVSNFSSNLFLTAAAQNLLCMDLAAQAGVAVSSPWLTWFIAAAPPCILGMVLTPLVMYKVRATQRLCCWNIILALLTN